MNELCITVPEMGKRLGVSRAMAYNLVNAHGFYPAFRIGRRVLIRVAALEKWLDEQTNLSKKEDEKDGK